MNREELIKKWLDHNLNANELEAFKKLEDYDALVKLNTITKQLKAPEYNTSEELSSVLSRLTAHQKPKTNWTPIIARIAAIFVICFGIYFYTSNLNTEVTTLVAQKDNIVLPDNSSVDINSVSKIEFSKNSWRDNREVKLEGEAYFKVAKGSKFSVITPKGTVSVLGTQFNVKQRDNYFEVVCYEGIVAVDFNNTQTKLKAGDRFLSIDGKLITNEKENSKAPSWLTGNSIFKSLPYKTVVKEFERQYDVKISLQNINDSQLFTGSFTHNNMELALKSITLPLQLTYTKTDHTITLKRE